MVFFFFGRVEERKEKFRGVFRVVPSDFFLHGLYKRERKRE